MVEEAGIAKGGLEGLRSLRYWPQIVRQYGIALHDASLINLLYMAVFGRQASKESAFEVMTQSRSSATTARNRCAPPTAGATPRRCKTSITPLPWIWW